MSQHTDDARALRDYVDGLPEAERVAYYRANPDYMDGQYPAHLSYDAGQLYAAGDKDGAVALLHDYNLAQWRAEIERDRVAMVPGTGDRIANTVHGMARGAFPAFMITLAAGAFLGPHVAAAASGCTMLFGTLGALAGFCKGGFA